MNERRLNVLVLGTSTGAEEAIAHLQQRGHRVLITDFDGDTNHPAKRAADAVHHVSTEDLPALERLCEEEGVTAVFAGVNERNMKSAIHLSEQLGLPYFCTRAQWDRLMDKEQFRELSHSVEMPAPDTYFTGTLAQWNADAPKVAFPCVVKPVDNSSLRGITVCQSEDQLPQALLDAEAAASEGRIIIEEFMEGNEFTAAYVVVDGRAVMSTVDDRLPLTLPGMTTSYPALRVYPARGAATIKEQLDGPVQAMCDQVGLDNCCLFVQGFEDDGRVGVFEAGLRLAGETPYRFLEGLNGTNQLMHLVDSSVGTAGAHPVDQEDPFLGGKVAAIHSFIGTGGTIAEIAGLSDALADIPQIVRHEVRHGPGQEIPLDGSLRQIVLRFILVCENEEELIKVAQDLNRRVQVLDAQGQSLVAKPDPATALGRDHG